MLEITQQIALDIQATPEKVAAAIRLLDEGATVPFIARYRKEATGGLDDQQLRLLENRLGYLRELNDRRRTILESIDQQGKLTPELQQQLMLALTKTELEDLYLPYKPKRRTKAQIAREAGIEPLAQAILTTPMLDLDSAALDYLNEDAGFTDSKSVLEGARFILIEHFAESAVLLKRLREALWSEGILSSVLMQDKHTEGLKFQDYFEFNETIRTIPSHRALALLRGRNEGILNLTLQLPDTLATLPLQYLIETFALTLPLSPWLQDTLQLTWKAKLHPSLSNELIQQLRENAETEAILVFATNLKSLLLAAPAGGKSILGIDPGLRTGCKVACVDHTGKILETTTIYPHVPHQQWQNALATLAALCQKHRLQLVAIGNGTASRETDKLVDELLKLVPDLQKVMVSEAGASVYSASELASQELPELDVSLRGAVSIARRLQDPLAELVKIDPKSIGVGQYQHDVNPLQLAKRLDAVVEDCVNAVGVDINTASAALLSRVSGLNQTLAKNIVVFRDANGSFKNRQQLKKISRFGDKTFEQAAGFLRLWGENPLDRSAVHPEAYPVVERILQHQQITIEQLIGNSERLRKLKPQDYVCERFGLPTVQDIFKELEKPGRDPRPEFVTAQFKEGIETLNDLKPDMVLQGVVTNVANFGAFVDIGVHQDGLVHISALSHDFVKDPHQVVKVGQIVSVKVLEVDLVRKRIQLTMRLSDNAKNAAVQHTTKHNDPTPKPKKPTSSTVSHNPFADALKGLKR